MDHVLGLKCVLCGAKYDVDEVLYVCPKHGDEGMVDVVYDYELIGRRLTKEKLEVRNWRLAMIPLKLQLRNFMCYRELD